MVFENTNISSGNINELSREKYKNVDIYVSYLSKKYIHLFLILKKKY